MEVEKELEGEFSDLSDEALTAMAEEMRREASQGHRPAYGRAHELEKEVRRRRLVAPHASSALAAADPTLAVLPTARRAVKWRFWRQA